MVTQVAVRQAGLILDGQFASYRAEVPSELLDEQGQILDGLIGFAFDVLGARYLDVRVLGSGDAPDGQPSLAPTGSTILAWTGAHPRCAQQLLTLASIQP